MEASDNPCVVFGAMFIVGIALALAFFVLMVLAEVWKRAFAWIDDESPAKQNPVTSYLMKRLGFSPRDSYNEYEDSTGREVFADGKLAALVMAIVLTPPAVFLTIKFYPVALVAGVLFLMAHLARFAVRTKKLFAKHLSDPDAHK